MSCRISLEKLSVKLTQGGGKLSGRLAVHAASCSDCQEKIRLLTQTSRLLDGSGMTMPPENLWENIASRLEPRQPAVKARSRFRRLALGASAAAALMLAIVFQTTQSPQVNGDIETFYRMHQSLTPASASQFVDSSQLESFRSKTQFDISLPKNLPPGWKLVNLRQTQCARCLPVAHLVYSDGKHIISIFEKPASGGKGWNKGRGKGACDHQNCGTDCCNSFGNGKCVVKRFHGETVVMAASDSKRFFVYGDLPAEELQKIARQLASQM